MRIVMLTENDPAGMGIAFCNAVNTFTDHSCRLITRSEKYGIDFQKDIHLPDLDESEYEEVEEILKQADIFHFHILSDETMTVGPFKVLDYIRGRSILHHHHGHPDFRANPKKFSEKYRRLGRKMLVSTPDLLKLVPEAEWMPNLVPVHDSRFMPAQPLINGTIRACQAPTRKDLKNTNEFISVCGDLKRLYSELECVIIENTVYDECLSIKQSCDIHFDHMQGYYGVSSLESLSLGKPVIAGIDDWNIRHICEFTQTEDLPWIVSTNSEELRQKMMRLIVDRDERLTKGNRSREFMVDHWSDSKIARRLETFYATL